MTKTCKICGNPDAWGSGLPGEGERDYTQCDICGAQTHGGRLAVAPKGEAFESQGGKPALLGLEVARGLGLIHNVGGKDVLVTHGPGGKDGARAEIPVREITGPEKAALAKAGKKS